MFLQYSARTGLEKTCGSTEPYCEPVDGGMSSADVVLDGASVALTALKVLSLGVEVIVIVTDQ